MASTIDDICIDYTDENGDQIVKQLDKIVLSRGAWTTILFLYTEWDRKKSCWGAPKARVERFQKFKFSSAKQAQQIIDAFQDWIASGQFAGDGLNDEE